MFQDDQATVMGPELDSIPHHSLLTTPILKPETDRLQWREEIRDWSINVVACAEGGDGRAKGVATCLGLTVYRSLETSLKEQVKESVRCGEIVLKPSGDKNTDVQMKTLEKIISIVARDTPVDRVTRMVRLNTQVHRCIRKDTESIKTYINRFKAPALAYLNLTRSGQDSSDSQVFAMTLILNAKLPTQTFSNLISSIINTVSAKKGSDNGKTAIKTDRLKTIINLLNSTEGTSEECTRDCVATAEAAMAA